MKIRRPFRAVIYVAVIAAAMGYVWQSAKRASSANTTIGRLMRGGGGSGDIRADGFQRMATLENNADAWRMVDGLPRVDGQSQPPNRVVVFLEVSFSSSGFWHAVSEERAIVVHLDSKRPQPIAAIDGDTANLIVEAVQTDCPEVAPEGVAWTKTARGRTTRRLLVSGIVGDISILAAFAAIIFSFVILRREIKWRKPGCCTECDYDLAGLTADKCPECGAAVKSPDSPKVT